MVRINSKRLFTISLLCSLVVFTCGAAFAAADKGYSSADLKKMSTFLSNFTEGGADKILDSFLETGGCPCTQEKKE